MKEIPQSGDLVLSLAGRDKGGIFLVIKSEGDCIWITDGKVRKVARPKRKKHRHVQVVMSAADTALAERIARGEAVSDRRVKALIAACLKNKTGGESSCQKTT